MKGLDMPQKKINEDSVSVGVSMKGELATVFDDLYFTALRNKQVRSRAEYARSLIVSQLNIMGFSVQDNTSWGGWRDRTNSAAIDISDND